MYSEMNSRLRLSLPHHRRTAGQDSRAGPFRRLPPGSPHPLPPDSAHLSALRSALFRSVPLQCHRRPSALPRGLRACRPSRLALARPTAPAARTRTHRRPPLLPHTHKHAFPHAPEHTRMHKYDLPGCHSASLSAV